MLRVLFGENLQGKLCLDTQNMNNRHFDVETDYVTLPRKARTVII